MAHRHPSFAFPLCSQWCSARYWMWSSEKVQNECLSPSELDGSVNQVLESQGRAEGRESREQAAWPLGPITHLCRHVHGEHWPLAGGQGLQNTLSNGGLPSPYWTHQQYRILVGHQGTHQVVVANSVDSGHHDFIEWGTREEKESCLKDHWPTSF